MKNLSMRLCNNSIQRNPFRNPTQEEKKSFQSIKQKLTKVVDLPNLEKRLLVLTVDGLSVLALAEQNKPLVVQVMDDSSKAAGLIARLQNRTTDEIKKEQLAEFSSIKKTTAGQIEDSVAKLLYQLNLLGDAGIPNKFQVNQGLAYPDPQRVTTVFPQKYVELFAKNSGSRRYYSIRSAVDTRMKNYPNFKTEMDIKPIQYEHTQDEKHSFTPYERERMLGELAMDINKEFTGQDITVVSANSNRIRHNSSARDSNLKLMHEMLTQKQFLVVTVATRNIVGWKNYLGSLVLPHKTEWAIIGMRKDEDNEVHVMVKDPRRGNLEVPAQLLFDSIDDNDSQWFIKAGDDPYEITTEIPRVSFREKLTSRLIHDVVPAIPELFIYGRNSISHMLTG